jgi:YD repeat-containing protein
MHRTIITNKDAVTNTTATTTILSDFWGNRLSMEEPNAQKIESQYNKFNELVWQKDANNNITTYQYDNLGRVTQKQFSKAGTTLQTISYMYDITNNKKGKISKILINNVDDEVFFYDALSRLNQKLKRIDGVYYTFLYSYTPNGQLKTLGYPGGFKIDYSYTSTGKLNEIKRVEDNDNTLIYKVDSRNKYHAPTKCEYGNGVITNYTYNQYHY